jgi:uncharacterized delta-60 repeat protein
MRRPLRPLALLLLATPALAADGALDPTFSGDGIAVFGTAATDPYPRDALVAPDGALVVAGYGKSGGDAGFDWRRVTSAGPQAACSLVVPGSSYGWAAAAAFDGSGRLVLAGYASVGFAYVPVVARYLYPACALDPAFDGDGWASYDLVADVAVAGMAIARFRVGILTVERIVLFGPWGDPSTTTLAAVLSVRPNGTLDPAFESDGMMLLSFGGTLRGPRIVASGSRILVGSTYEIGNEGDLRLFAIKASDGALDHDWGSSGSRTIDLGDGAGFDDDELSAMELDRTGRLLLAAASWHDAVESSALVRLEADGDLDPTLAGDGTLLLARATYPLLVTALAEQIDGKLLLAGGGELDGEGAAGALRLLPGGAVDATYGAGGLALHVVDVYPASSTESAYPAAAVVWGGRATLVGGSQQTDENRGFVARLTAALIFRDGFESGSTARWPGF